MYDDTFVVVLTVFKELVVSLLIILKDVPLEKPIPGNTDATVPFSSNPLIALIET